jgi:hypothetical protein
MVKSSCVMCFHKSAVAKWIASIVLISVGIGCEARSNTIASQVGETHRRDAHVAQDAPIATRV